MVQLKINTKLASTSSADRLLVFAPAQYRKMLTEKLSRHYPVLQIVDCENPQTSALSPNSILEYMPAGILLIVKGNRAPAKVVPTPLIHGIPVGILPCNGLAGLEKWLASIERRREKSTQTIGVLAMWKDFYLKWGNHFYDSLQKGYGKTPLKIQKWFADEVERDKLCQSISQGADLLLYAGHGRSRGWTGYRGLRWQHLEEFPQQEPTGTVISLTCSNLEVTQYNRIPFGVQWVRSGRACAFLGAVSGIKVAPLIHISNVIKDCFAQGKLTTIGALMHEIEKEVNRLEDKELNRCWREFRLIGNPLEDIYRSD